MSFDLNRATSGEPIQQRNGRLMTILSCHYTANVLYAIPTNSPDEPQIAYHLDGRIANGGDENLNLMMVPTAWKPPFRAIHVVRAIAARVGLVATSAALMQWSASWLVYLSAGAILLAWAVHKFLHASQRVTEAWERDYLLARNPAWLRVEDTDQLEQWASETPNQVATLVTVRGFDVSLALALMTAGFPWLGFFILAGTCLRTYADLRLFKQADAFGLTKAA